MVKVSILMPVYNEEKFILQSVQSILNQDYKDFELIIVDDGSIDGTWDILSRIVDKRLKIYNYGKIGKNAALNRAYEHSSGDWLILFAGDDVMESNSLKQRVESISKFNAANKVVGYSRLRIISENKLFDGMQVPKNKSKGLSSGATVIFSRPIANMFFPIPTGYPNEDTWMGLHFEVFIDQSIHIPIVTTIYRIHENNSLKRTKNFKEASKSLNDRYLIYDEFISRYRNKIDKHKLEELERIVEVEKYRYQGKTIRILLFPGLSFKNRMKFSMSSNSGLYRLKYILSRFLIGWS